MIIILTEALETRRLLLVLGLSRRVRLKRREQSKDMEYEIDLHFTLH